MGWFGFGPSGMFGGSTYSSPAGSFGMNTGGGYGNFDPLGTQDGGSSISKVRSFVDDVAGIWDRVSGIFDGSNPDLPSGEGSNNQTGADGASQVREQAGAFWDDVVGTVENIVKGAFTGARTAAAGANAGSSGAEWVREHAGIIAASAVAVGVVWWIKK